MYDMFINELNKLVICWTKKIKVDQKILNYLSPNCNESFL